MTLISFRVSSLVAFDRASPSLHPQERCRKCTRHRPMVPPWHLRERSIGLCLSWFQRHPMPSLGDAERSLASSRLRILEDWRNLVTNTQWDAHSKSNCEVVQICWEEIRTKSGFKQLQRVILMRLQSDLQIRRGPRAFWPCWWYFSHRKAMHRVVEGGT